MLTAARHITAGDYDSWHDEWLSIAEAITCSTLVCDAEDDLFFAGQPQQLYDHLTCPKTLLHFKNSEGAGAHCYAGAQRLAYARIYDWLDGVLKPTR